MLPFEYFVTIVKSGAGAAVGELLLQHRTFITKLAISRTAGSGDVSVELFEKDPTTLDTGEDPCYRVTDSVTTSSGISTNFFSYPRVFVSHDALDSNNMRTSKLYIRLGTTGQGTFKIAVAGFSGMA